MGHLFQGRYKAILGDEEAYLLEVASYVVLNPVRASIVRAPGEWPRCSYLPMVGGEPAPDWLQVDALLARFGSRRTRAQRRYAEFVAEGMGAPSRWQGFRG